MDAEGSTTKTRRIRPRGRPRSAAQTTYHQAVERRALLKLLSLASLGSLTAGAACSDEPAGACEPTRSDVEGPYYTAQAPARERLAEDDEPGEPLLLTGRLLTAGCARPLAGYLLDVWHADDSGAYDNEGFTLRGVFTTDDEGRFAIETILPGRYPDRPVRHVHLKLRDPAGEELLTTQIYFEGDEQLAGGGYPGPRARLDGGIAEVDLILDV